MAQGLSFGFTTKMTRVRILCCSVETLGKHQRTTALYLDIEEHQWPIIYSSQYNISFLGLEKLHPFDSCKWSRIYNFLKEAGMVKDSTIVQPLEAQKNDLLSVHSQRYINCLKWSIKVAGITEVPPVALLPNFIVQWRVLRPFRFHTGGTVLAAKLALERGWAINLGGGFHHCSATRGGGFCAYADITIAITLLFDHMPSVTKVMIIDLDAHQGNGYERDFMEDSRVYILDMFNRQIYPHDGYAKRSIKRKVELMSDVGDTQYLALVRRHVEAALKEFPPDLIVYNAGTDVLHGDRLGHLSLSPQGVIERDQIVFQKARTRNIPIMMLTSGGYQSNNARVIADSILNLHSQRLITCDSAESYADNGRPGGISESQSDGHLMARQKAANNSMNNTGSPEDGQLWNRRNPPNNSMSHSQTQQQFPTPDT
ncbi:hypothetical protein NP493_542g01037 [Ridgeia piscesae]|uniref:Histone deacetylase 11 n=1 Tax=Ridgeia piscesae TaxID=27915 RepID=A0AAD9KW93_RIDPI|nr:hypothetical protein NP493_542g01037 [Ridgeia piscesae]